jgi:hypothetical protein
MLTNPKDVLKTCFNKVNNGFHEVQSKFAGNTGENVEDRVAMGVRRRGVEAFDCTVAPDRPAGLP